MSATRALLVTCPATAVAGGYLIVVDPISGTRVTVTLPPGTQPGMVLTVAYSSQPPVQAKGLKVPLVDSSPVPATVERSELPKHGCCARICLFALAWHCMVVSSPCILHQLVREPCVFCTEVICKVTCCRCCCSDDCERFSHQAACTPCRWISIAYTGEGYIGCCQTAPEAARIER
jgi:hypothetical protein